MTQMSLYRRCDFLRIHAIPHYREALPAQPALGVPLHAVPGAFESSAASPLQNKHLAYRFAPHLLFSRVMLLFCPAQLSSAVVSSPIRTPKSLEAVVSAGQDSKNCASAF